MKILTWNSRGQTLQGYEWRLQKYKPDIMVVQECGNLGAKFPDAVEGRNDRCVKAGTFEGYNFWWLDWSRTGAGSNNPRCSLAMIYKDEGQPGLMVAQVHTKRPVLFKTIYPFVVCNIHAGGLDYIKEVLGKRRSIAGSEKEYVVAGDFNQSPITVASMAKKSGMHVIRSGKPTRPESKREIDYAVSSVKDGDAELTEHYLGSDHVAVLIEF
jgi:hypothetical protein